MCVPYKTLRQHMVILNQLPECSVPLGVAQCLGKFSLQAINLILQAFSYKLPSMRVG
jgi:hypothetical protein